MVFTDGTKSACTQLEFNGFLHDEVQPTFFEFDLDVFHFKQLLVLFHKNILRLRKDLAKCYMIERVEERYNRQTTDQLRDQSESFQVLRRNELQ